MYYDLLKTVRYLYIKYMCIYKLCGREKKDRSDLKEDIKTIPLKVNHTFNSLNKAFNTVFPSFMCR